MEHSTIPPIHINFCAFGLKICYLLARSMQDGNDRNPLIQAKEPHYPWLIRTTLNTNFLSLNIFPANLFISFSSLLFLKIILLYLQPLNQSLAANLSLTLPLFILNCSMRKSQLVNKYRA